jgi:hypothetical protein
MFNRTTSITRFVMGLLLVALIAGCAGSATQESTGEYIDDSSITASVKAATMTHCSRSVRSVLKATKESCS